MRIEREQFYKPGEIANSVRAKIEQVRGRGEPTDYLTFVPDGETTLDTNLGEEIDLLKPFGIKIAIITNASLIWHEDVKRDLQKADWVSLKVDAVSKESWCHIDHPHKQLNLDKILEGMLEFSRIFKGKLVTESMLIRGINDSRKEVKRIADFLAELKPCMSYLSIPTRPPARRTISAASEENVNMAYQLFTERLNNVECLTGYEGNAFASTGNAIDDLLSITSVHPMREEGIEELLKKDNAGWDVIKGLLKDGRLIETNYERKRFYMRKFSRTRNRAG